MNICMVCLKFRNRDIIEVLKVSLFIIYKSFKEKKRKNVVLSFLILMISYFLIFLNISIYFFLFKFFVGKSDGFCMGF